MLLVEVGLSPCPEWLGREGLLVQPHTQRALRGQEQVDRESQRSSCSQQLLL